MPVFEKCGHCGKSLDEGKKTCGASFAICNKCKMLIHPHCMGEHKLLHNHQDNIAKYATKTKPVSILSRIFNFIKGIVE
jgi:hypothetical protein